MSEISEQYQGKWVSNFNGDVLSSSGYLQNADIFNLIEKILSSSKILISKGDTNFKRVVVTFKDFKYIITVTSEQQIIVYYIEIGKVNENSNQQFEQDQPRDGSMAQQ